MNLPERLAIMYHPHPNWPRLGGFLARAAEEFCHVESFEYGEETEGFDAYLYIDTSPTPKKFMTPKCRPAIYYAADLVVPKLWHSQAPEVMVKLMRNFDYNIVSSSAVKEYCNERGLETQIVGFAADPEYHKPSGAIRDKDWVAIWHNCAGRVEASKQAKTHFPNGMVTWKGLHYYSEWTSRGKCALNFLRANAVNMRVFEVMAIGTPLITHRHHDMQHFGFVEYEHFLGFDDLQEMLQKIAWVQSEPVESLEMAARAREFVLANHTYRNRFLEIFDGR